MAHVVDDRAVFGEMQRVPAVKDVHGGEQQGVLGERRQTGLCDERIDGIFTETDIAAVSALAHPLGERE